MYLALTGEHVLLLSIGIGICTSIKARHGIIQNAIELHRKDTLSIVVLDALSELQGCVPPGLIIRDVLGLECGLSLCLNGCDGSLLDFQLIRVEHNLTLKRIQFLKATVNPRIRRYT